MKRFLTLVTALSFAVLSTGCGQSGPLYVPGNPSKISQLPPASASTTEEESDENGDNGEAEKE